MASTLRQPARVLDIGLTVVIEQYGCILCGLAYSMPLWWQLQIKDCFSRFALIPAIHSIDFLNDFSASQKRLLEERLLKEAKKDFKSNKIQKPSGFEFRWRVRAVFALRPADRETIEEQFVQSSIRVRSVLGAVARSSFTPLRLLLCEVIELSFLFCPPAAHSACSQSSRS